MGIRGDQAKQIGDLLAEGKSIPEIAGTVGLDIGDVQSVLAGATRTYVETLEGGLPTSGGGGGGGGGPTPGALRVIKFDFAHDTPNLDNGVPIYTPTVGELLFDAWIDVDVAFDGTTPRADLAQQPWFDAFSGEYGWISAPWEAVDLTQPCGDGGGATQLPPGVSVLSMLNVNVGDVPPQYSRQTPKRFTTTDPVLLVVSQSGGMDTGPTGATVGSGTAYLAVASPVTA